MKAEVTWTLIECPACGRRMRVRIELLGREVQCAHCGQDCVVQADGSVAQHHRILNETRS